MPLLRHDKAVMLHKQQHAVGSELPEALKRRSVLIVLRAMVTLSVKLLFTQPIIMAISIFGAYSFGVLFIFVSTHPQVWTQLYHETTTIGGLNYISYGLGLFLGTQIGTRFGDYHYRRVKLHDDSRATPELRLILMAPAATLMPAALLLFGWSVEHRLHWIVPNAASVLLGAAYIMPLQCTQGYIVDAFPNHAASATAAANVLRSFTAFEFPIFAPALYARLGWGWGNSVLALVAMTLGVPIAFLLRRFGAALRARSSLAIK